MTATTYWNHNAAYHPWIVGIAASHRGDVLDVGCGEGLLLERLAPVCRSVVGVEPDTASAERARRRVVAGGQRAAHVRVVALLRPGGELLVVGSRRISASRSPSLGRIFATSAKRCGPRSRVHSSGEGCTTGTLCEAGRGGSRPRDVARWPHAARVCRH